MKKLILFVATIVAISFAACNCATKEGEEAAQVAQEEVIVEEVIVEEEAVPNEEGEEIIANEDAGTEVVEEVEVQD